MPSEGMEQFDILWDLKTNTDFLKMTQMVLRNYKKADGFMDEAVFKLTVFLIVTLYLDLAAHSFMTYGSNDYHLGVFCA